MADQPFIIPQPILPVGKTVSQPKKNSAPGTAFNELLQKEIQQAQDLKFSRHAQERLDARRIDLSPQHMARLQEAVQKAEAKGCRESLVLVDDLTFVVSIKNKTVITAVDGENRKENVFTNIDSAVIN